VSAPVRSNYLGSLISSWTLFTCFTFYVTFVQYALLGRATAELGLREDDLMGGFALLALFGIAGSLIAGWRIDRRGAKPAALLRATGILSLLLIVCAWIAMRADSKWALNLALAPMGFVLGVTIVVLLYQFLLLTDERSRGLYAGLAAGLVYFVANLEACVAGSPRVIGVLDIALVLSNVALIFRFAPWPPNDAGSMIGVDAGVTKMLGRLWPLALVVLLDTALFVHVSRAAGAGAVFTARGSWLANGFFHFLFAMAAGLVYRRWGWRRLTLLAGFALLFTTAIFALQQLGSVSLSAGVIVLYSLSVGVYTVVLFSVFGEETPRSAPALGIALGMVLIGWLASPAGIALGTALLGAY